MALETSQDIRDALDLSNSQGSDDIQPDVIEIEEIVIPSPSTSRPVLLQTTIGNSGRCAPSNVSSPTTWKKRTPGRQASSKVWDYFVYDTTTDYSKCSLEGCPTEKIKGKNASNLKKHLQHFHEKEFDVVTTSDKVSKEISVPVSSSVDIPKSQFRLNAAATLVDLKYDNKNPKQVKWNRQLTMLFGANPVPNHLIMNEDFRKLQEIADPRLVFPSRPALEKSIDQLMSEVKQSIIGRLNLARRINFSSDIWTKKGMTGSYLGVMATIYDRVEERKLNMVLSVKKFRDVRHTAANINEEMKNLLESYNICESKVWKMVTDSGSNMVCAFRDQLFALPESLESTEFGENEVEDLYDYDDTNEEDQVADVPATKYGRLPCFIHSLLLCLKKFEAGKIFENLVTKVKTLVSKFSSSQVLTGELVRLSGLKLLSFSNTRWNITFLVVQRLSLVKDSVVIVLQKYDKTKYNLSDSEWDLLLRTRDFLAPFNKFTDMSSTEGTRALSEVVMILKQLQAHLRKYSTVRPFITVSKDILKDTTERFGHFLSEHSSKPFEGIYLASTLLDPRYRIGLNAAEKSLAKSYILTSDWDWEPDNTIGDCRNTLDAENEVAKKKRKFEFLEELDETCDSNNLNMANEVNLYLENKAFDIDDDKCDPWKFWNQHKLTFPLLSAVALEILSIPLSIGQVERIFSYAGFATAGRRNRLDSEHLEREVFLNKNKHLLKFT